MKPSGKATSDYDVAWAALRLVLQFNKDLRDLQRRSDEAMYAALGKLGRMKP